MHLQYTEDAESVQGENYDLADLLSDEPSNLTVAVDLARKGLAVFPCGADKRPLTRHGFKDASNDVAKVRAWWLQWPAALPALPTGNAFDVLDLDRHKEDEDGIDALRGIGFEPETLSTFVVETPSGGRHVYFRHADGVGTSDSHLPAGINVRGSGGYVIAPGAMLPDGCRYRMVIGVDIHDLPQWPAALLPPRRYDFADLLADRPSVDWDKVKRALGFIDPDCRREEWRNVGMALYAGSGGTEEAFQLWDKWSARAVEPGKYIERQMRGQWRSFGRRSGVDIGTLFHIAGEYGWVGGIDIDPDDFPDLPPDWGPLLDRDKDKRLKKTAYNVCVIIEHDPTTAGVFALDEFRQRNFIAKRPGSILTGEHWAPGPMTDIHETAVKAWLSAPRGKGGWGLESSMENVRGAIDLAAHANRFHPVRDRLASFAYDGKPRGESLFVDYLGCPDTPYYRETARMVLLGAVARIFEPGHKFDFMPIIEGKQGIRKSTFVKALGLDWAGDPSIDWTEGKGIIEQTEGYWLIEVPELSSMARAESNDLKANLSRTSDKARLSYAHNPITRPRQCIFIGTTNDRDYLRDPSGNRRFWPIPATVAAIDTDKLRSEAPQIWAEAVGWYRAMREAQPRGDLDLSLRSEAANAEALDLQGSRKAETAEDVLAGQIGAWLEQPIGAWLEQPIGAEFDDLDADAPKTYRAATCTAQIWSEMLDGRGAVPQHEAMKIGKALQQIGWRKSPNKTTHPELRQYGKCSVYARG